ncbi:glycosyltransferase [Thermoleptolyngbya oregonensis NK1-22]|uniref:Glycosyltransferase n=1 Tax=Thermoleptolyngbya oregonensis NK1-22 TaxID=2547457 RepID=A0AA96YLV5_9CYAN|nr:glycosyltransferase [Thermoleptolyngbya oregonensis NK1-22]
MNPRISVVIPHFNDLENLKICLSCLMNQTLPLDQFEIIVADNNSSLGLDAVRSVVTEITNCKAKVISAPIQGAAEARNAGVLVSQSEILAFIDSDCQPSEDWLENGLRAMEQAKLVGGRVRVLLNNPDDPHPVEAFESVFAFNNQSYVLKKQFSVTANLWVSREVFNVVGGFRQGVSEDMDWCHRAIAAGYSLVYQDDVCVGHPARRTWAELARKWQRLTRESYHLIRERRLGYILWMMRNWVVLLSALPHTLVILNSKKLSRLEDRLRAILILFRLRLYRFFEAHRLMLSD